MYNANYISIKTNYISFWEGEMEPKHLLIKDIPTLIWGTQSDKVFLYVHGQGGNKEEAQNFAAIVQEHDYQVLSIDLPKHGERKTDKKSFEPWEVTPELCYTMNYIKQNWKTVALFANSIGAWFSMLAFKDELLEKCLFLSPIVDMENLISEMMKWANVSEKQLQEEQFIHTDFGQTLSWRYWIYAKDNPITIWNTPTKILYGEKDNLVANTVIAQFAEKFNCDLTMLKGGEHWFHTPQQLDILYGWIQNSFQTSQERFRTDRFL